jgi:hypothetical protein
LLASPDFLFLFVPNLLGEIPPGGGERFISPVKNMFPPFLGVPDGVPLSYPIPLLEASSKWIILNEVMNVSTLTFFFIFRVYFSYSVMILSYLSTVIFLPNPNERVGIVFCV